MTAMDPPSRLRVGVSGHRVPPKLPADSVAPVRALLDRILTTMVDAGRKLERHRIANAGGNAGDVAAEFVVVSSLAEGADRIVAEAGLAAGFALQAVLPFNAAEYARDFETQASRAAFERLLNRAAAVFDLNGAADQRPRAYEAAGLFMLANIDLLFAIWDGKIAAGVGGTADIVKRAVADGLLVVWIEPIHPDAFNVSWLDDGKPPRAKAFTEPGDVFRSADMAAVVQAVKEIMAGPSR
jgi:hypothetical protein